MSKVKLLPKLLVFGDPSKGPVAEAIADFSDFVQGRAEIAATCGLEECVGEQLEGCRFAVIFGGDGSIISAARQLSVKRVPVIGVNMGKLGYLAEFGLGEIKALFDDILSGKAPIERRMMLGCRVVRGGREQFRSMAVNDVVITAGPPFRMIELQMAVDGEPIGGCVGDGLIICTPTGSTAHNLSAGGPILAGSMEAMVITAICPHSLSFRPLVITAGSVIEVTGVRVNEGTTVSIDGQVSMRLTGDDVVHVVRADGDFLVVGNPLRSRWDTLATKLSWAEKPKYKE